MPDVPEHLAAEAVDALRPMTINASTDITSTLVTNWANSAYEGSMAYVRCTQDAAIPIDFQDLMVERSKGNWTILSMDTSHSPFLNRPAELAEIVSSLAKQFTS